MKAIINFEIKPTGKISKLFLGQQLTSFSQACQFIKLLPYARNKNKADLSTIFTENCGTCSTKHALLKKLAEENNVTGLKLITGIFKMKASNTAKIAAILKQYKIDYLPEAHNYLKYKDQNLDFTSKNSKPADFENDLIKEIEIETNQITDFKINFHKQFLINWLENEADLHYTLDELWTIREECINALSTVN